MRTARLRLDFAPGARRVSWAGRALLALSLAVFGYGVFECAELWSTRAHAVSDLRELNAQRSQTDASKARNANPDPRQIAYARAAHQVENKLMTPWAGLLSSLGAAPTAAVALLAVEPSTTKHSVRLTGEARDPHEMLVYVGALQRDARLAAVVLVSHQLQVTAPGKPVRFQVQAEWSAAP